MIKDNFILVVAVGLVSAIIILLGPLLIFLWADGVFKNPKTGCSTIISKQYSLVVIENEQGLEYSIRDGFKLQVHLDANDCVFVDVPENIFDEKNRGDLLFVRYKKLRLSKKTEIVEVV